MLKVDSYAVCIIEGKPHNIFYSNQCTLHKLPYHEVDKEVIYSVALVDMTSSINPLKCLIHTQVLSMELVTVRAHQVVNLVTVTSNLLDR